MSCYETRYSCTKRSETDVAYRYLNAKSYSLVMQLSIHILLDYLSIYINNGLGICEPFTICECTALLFAAVYVIFDEYVICSWTHIICSYIIIYILKWKDIFQLQYSITFYSKITSQLNHALHNEIASRLYMVLLLAHRQFVLRVVDNYSVANSPLKWWMSLFDSCVSAELMVKSPVFAETVLVFSSVFSHPQDTVALVKGLLL